METKFSLFNQINSLCYWLLVSSDYRSSVNLDAENDTYSVCITHCGVELYSNIIRGFSKRDENFLEHELDGMVAGLLHLKENVTQKSA
ncbi:hypothetical protein H8K90_07830 [Winogradskyella echinorum]|uniref:Uncharacterized protein n=1 Tax=Winogradskyella echinorum TaxID=538189 RepID=A0ABR6Y0W6_9FLAO|nr:hypothetical protein [Winogradskyella echinorum]MBC3846284.1 hypothetical protein [Winogradskyella echinorum]MBC5750632.1 hypothetical protein [Winogradskyella echinorum]